MKYKNYYKILELKSSRATEDEIKIAYRRLAKKYHPDINPGDEVANEKFKLINEAYQVLSDENARRKFDRVHSIYKVKDTFADTKDKFNSDGFSEMIDIIFGKENNGFLKQDTKKKNSTNGRNIDMQICIKPEDAFWGSEKKVVCKSKEEKSFHISIPQGIRNGDIIRIEGRGKPGIDGGNNGDLFIKILYEDSDKYKILDDDIHIELKLTPWEAALGTKVYVDNIDSSVQIDVPGGTESGENIVIPEKGFWKKDGGRGNLVLQTKIMVPPQMTDSETLLFKRFSEISQYNPRTK